jgi:hypothetical protein
VLSFYWLGKVAYGRSPNRARSTLFDIIRHILTKSTQLSNPAPLPSRDRFLPSRDRQEAVL